MLTAVLYPYVYLLGRSAFLGQSRQSLEVARSLGRGYGRAVWTVALPLARPALAAGAALAVMEALADFGAVNLLGYQTLTDAIYRVWYGGVRRRPRRCSWRRCWSGLALLMVVAERVLRGRARYHQALPAATPSSRAGCTGWRAALAATASRACCSLLVFALPVAQLRRLVGGDGRDAAGSPTGSARPCSARCCSPSPRPPSPSCTSTVVVYGQRVAPSRLGAAAARLAAVGYAVPGLGRRGRDLRAAGVAGPPADRGSPASWFGVDIGLLFTGTVLGLVGAYVVRFHAQAYFSLESRMARIPPNLDDAARALGADRARVLTDVHLPLLWPGVVTAALLVTVEVIKELPATALLRPLGRDTLAIMTWEATKDSRFDTAALPALLIVLVGLVPVVVLVKLWARQGSAVRGAVPPVPQS